MYVFFLMVLWTLLVRFHSLTGSLLPIIGLQIELKTIKLLIVLGHRPCSLLQFDCSCAFSGTAHPGTKILTI